MGGEHVGIVLNATECFDRLCSLTTKRNCISKGKGAKDCKKQKCRDHRASDQFASRGAAERHGCIFPLGREIPEASAELRQRMRSIATEPSRSSNTRVRRSFRVTNRRTDSIWLPISRGGEPHERCQRAPVSKESNGGQDLNGHCAPHQRWADSWLLTSRKLVHGK